MINKIILTLYFIGIFFTVSAQYVFVAPGNGTSLSCHVNVNERADQNFRNDIKRAAFLFYVTMSSGTFSCSGTLVNRNTGQSAMSQYFVTAWHCFKSGSNCGGSQYDFSQPITMVFNYQSPDGNSQVFQQNQFGEVYQIRRQVRLVDHFDCAYGDFALCEVLGDPIPPYFNVYYAGWTPNDLFVNAGGPFATIHHPSGSIKKISGKDVINVPSGPVKSVCQVVTKVIDFLFGWLWKRRWSTQVVCTYVQLPAVGTKYGIGKFNFGVVEDGSSGGGLFNGNNKLIGQLSADWPAHSCNFINFGLAEFGKFSDSYYRQTIKNTLNPPNKYWIDQSGIPGRQISCYPQLTIGPDPTRPGGADLYPSSLYQQDNRITLSSRTTTTTNNAVTVHTGADFVFEAGTGITLNPGFVVEPGAAFAARIAPSPCTINESTYRTTDEMPSEYVTPDMNEVLKSIPVPKEKKFEVSKYLKTGEDGSASKNITMNVFPNPTNRLVNVQAFFTEKQKNVSVVIYDLNGRLIWSKQYSNVYFVKEEVNIVRFASGIYNISVRSGSVQQSTKLVVAK